jgi:hypothetical protein
MLFLGLLVAALGLQRRQLWQVVRATRFYMIIKLSAPPVPFRHSGLIVYEINNLLPLCFPSENPRIRNPGMHGRQAAVASGNIGKV